MTARINAKPVNRSPSSIGSDGPLAPTLNGPALQWRPAQAERAAPPMTIQAMSSSRAPIRWLEMEKVRIWATSGPHGRSRRGSASYPNWTVCGCEGALGGPAGVPSRVSTECRGGLPGRSDHLRGAAVRDRRHRLELGWRRAGRAGGAGMKPALGMALTSRTFPALRHVLEFRAILWRQRRRWRPSDCRPAPAGARMVHPEGPPSAARGSRVELTGRREVRGDQQGGCTSIQPMCTKPLPPHAWCWCGCRCGGSRTFKPAAGRRICQGFAKRPVFPQKSYDLA